MKGSIGGLRTLEAELAAVHLQRKQNIRDILTAPFKTQHRHWIKFHSVNVAAHALQFTWPPHKASPRKGCQVTIGNSFDCSPTKSNIYMYTYITEDQRPGTAGTTATVSHICSDAEWLTVFYGVCLETVFIVSIFRAVGGCQHWASGVYCCFKAITVTVYIF